MKLSNLILLICFLNLAFVACNKDDDNNDTPTVVLRDREEQQKEDNDALLNYLNTHYFNETAIASIPNPKLSDIEIKTLETGATLPTGHAMLIDAVTTKETTIRDVKYNYYYLKLKPGDGTEKPHFSDTVRMLYEGFLINGTVFASTVIPEDSDLLTLLRGWRRVIPEFNTAASFVETDGDGTIEYIDPGLGVMFLPSGLAYFQLSPSTQIPPYSPLIFKFKVLQNFVADHDNDGVPSYKEDLNGDKIYDTNDDTDKDGRYNYLDSDDDGDGILTINEDINKDGDPTNDIGANGKPNYLDPEITIIKE